MSDYAEYASADEMCAAYRHARERINPVPLRALPSVKSEAGATRDWLFIATHNQPLTMAALIQEVSRASGVTVEDIKSNRRCVRTSKPRMAFYWLCRTYTSKTFPQIGRFISKDHSTVLNGALIVGSDMARFESVVSVVEASFGLRRPTNIKAPG